LASAENSVKDERKTKAQLIEELNRVRGRVAQLSSDRIVPRDSDRDRLLSGLINVSKAVLEPHSPEETLSALAREIVETGLLRSLMVALVDHEANQVRVVQSLAHHGDGRLDTGSERVIGLTYDLSDSNLTAEVARTGAMAVIDDFDERFDDSVDTPERSRGKTSMFIPVVYHGRVLAVLATGCDARDKATTLCRIQAIRPLLDLVGVALDHASLRNDLQSQVNLQMRELNRAVEQLREEARERRLNERRLVQSEERFRQLSEAIDEAFWLGTTDPGPGRKLLYASPAFERIFGIQIERVLESDAVWAECIHPEDRARVMDGLNRFLMQESEYGIEYRIVRPGGEIRWIWARAFKIRDSEGQPYRTAGIAQDITTRKRAEEALIERDRLHRRCIELLNAVPYQKDKVNHRYTFMGDAIEGLTGHREGDMTPAVWMQMVQETVAPAGQPSDGRAMDGTWRRDCRITTAAGETRWVADASIAIVDDNGTHVGNLGILQDITERKHTERELVHLERLRAIGELSAGVSHNLNNILTSVLGPAQMIKRQSSAPQITREADDIIAATMRATDLVHQLHASTRAWDEEDTQAVDVPDTIRQAIRTSRPRWKDQPESRGVTVEIVERLAEVTPVRGTVTGLHDIAVNLILNASDAMPEGGKITIRAEELDDSVRLSFSDTGIGMDEETRRRVFEPFFTTKADVGTGLGLATVHGAVTRWGGAIEVNSAPNHGSCFTIRLPVWRDAPTPPEQPQEEVQGRRGELLVVDDDRSVSGFLSRLLSASHSVATASSGQEALQEFGQGHFDVAMIDLGMEEVPGDVLAGKLRELDPAIGLVMITGWEIPEGDPRQKLFDFTVRKPFDDLAQLETAIGRAIALRDERARD
jgi:two-component system, cell cycle sensor histidine kinase and response regulator CckA